MLHIDVVSVVPKIRFHASIIAIAEEGVRKGICRTVPMVGK